MYLLIFFILLAESPLKDFFNARGDHWVSKLTAEIQSSLITSQLKKIPKDKREFDKDPVVHLEFSLDKGIKILIKNVDPYYESYLSIYENTLTQSGYAVILGRYPTWEKFCKYYKGKKIEKNVIQVHIKDGLREDYAIFYLRDDHQISQAKYYENKIEIARVCYEYKEYTEKRRTILVPSRLEIHIFHPKSEERNFFVELRTLKVEFSK